ncbi:MAG: hypothetical protein ACRD8Z_23945, partial [Nitrososphaeraceae archaeon]
MGIDHNTQGSRSATTTYTDVAKCRKRLQEKLKQSHWKTIGVKVRDTELPLLNRQLDRLNCVTLGDLVKDLMSGKISRLTDDQQIDILKTNLQSNGHFTVVEGRPYDFYKQIDIVDLQLYLKGKY